MEKDNQLQFRTATKAKNEFILAIAQDKLNGNEVTQDYLFNLFLDAYISDSEKTKKQLLKIK